MNRELNQINVIPLVDVMLALLVIVLTTATFMTAGQIPVNLAKAAMANDRQILGSSFPLPKRVNCS
jgi:biopolymer transport protein ExbD